MKKTEAVNHPSHYGGEANPYEAIKVIEAWRLGFCLGNTLKYIARAGLKPGSTTTEDLKKARWYLDREISRVERHDAFVAKFIPKLAKQLRWPNRRTKAITKKSRRKHRAAHRQS